VWVGLRTLTPILTAQRCTYSPPDPFAPTSVRCSEDQFKCQLNRARAADLIERIETSIGTAGP
jgi:hypothetical protein